MDRSRENISVAVIYFGLLSGSLTDIYNSIYIHNIETKSIDDRMKIIAAFARSVNCTFKL